MKKWTLIYITAAFLAFIGASPWEGAAAVAPEGELPATGHFVATNSFPRNTIVDITNLETGRSTRAIVANSLDSPGMLAIISRDAAELIGMRSGSVSRIRMVQPPEPIAYSRFTEGMASGNPSFDSGYNITDELYREDTYRPPVIERDETGTSVTGMAGPSYVLEPEWRTRDVIVDLHRIDEPAQLPVEPAAEYIAEPAVEEEKVDEKALYIAEPVVEEEKVEEKAVYIAEPVVEEEKVEKEAVYIAEPVVEEEKVEKEAVYIAEPVVEKETKEEIKYIAETPVPEQREYVLVTSEERPPENTIYGIDPADIIPGLSAAAPAKEPESRPPVITESNFSAPRVYELTRGWYYVQIGTYDSPQLVENALRQIDHSYKPVVYKDGDIWYRVLLGPLNQGESAAVLQRFKSIGYKDAFVRYAR
ncbi:MAG: SPOR domain-containing protein [Treponema sp.]|jgi:hypothetical protein|nr:SPOR domain-containing protein [Treponema sp.]